MISANRPSKNPCKLKIGRLPLRISWGSMSVLVQCAQKCFFDLDITSVQSSKYEYKNNASACNGGLLHLNCPRLWQTAEKMSFVWRTQKVVGSSSYLLGKWSRDLIGKIKTCKELITELGGPKQKTIAENSTPVAEMLLSKYHEIPLIPRKNVGELLFAKRHGLIFHIRTMASHNS